MTDGTLQNIYPVTTTFLPDNFHCVDPFDLPNSLKFSSELIDKIPFVGELAEIELVAYLLRRDPPVSPVEVDTWQLRPGVELIETSWSGLTNILNGASFTPVKQKSFVLLVPGDVSTPPEVLTPDKDTLLALKIVAENLDLPELARSNNITLNHLRNVLALGVARGVILQPRSKIARAEDFCAFSSVSSDFLTAQVFTLQWHITQNCDLHCRHCYDRSPRRDVSLAEGMAVLNKLYRFCKEKNVLGQVSFSGGNPLLHPHFYDFYSEARDKGFMTAVLGNPASRDEVEALMNIQPPEFFQVSLEGLRNHNDYIRGLGHFERTFSFLTLLSELRIFSMVMLTLTKANQNQVIPLAEVLRGKVDLFTFNRLAMVGRGSALASVSPDDYKQFLESYLAAAEHNPIMRLKDNLFNILRLQKDKSLEGGCAGFGCGAAFNFVSILPDGQVHACRKLPSMIGNIYADSLTDIYQSDIARKYRSGSSGCQKCKIRPVCGGCPAVAYGFGKDIFTEVDPYCFLDRNQNS